MLAASRRRTLKPRSPSASAAVSKDDPLSAGISTATGPVLVVVVVGGDVVVGAGSGGRRGGRRWGRRRLARRARRAVAQQQPDSEADEHEQQERSDPDEDRGQRPAAGSSDLAPLLGHRLLIHGRRAHLGASGPARRRLGAGDGRQHTRTAGPPLSGRRSDHRGVGRGRLLGGGRDGRLNLGLAPVPPTRSARPMAGHGRPVVRAGSGRSARRPDSPRPRTPLGSLR